MKSEIVVEGTVWFDVSSNNVPCPLRYYHSFLIHGVSTMGINTPLIQSGIEFHGKAYGFIPGKFTARVDMKEKNVKFEAQPCQQENDLLHIRYILKVNII